MASLRRTSAVLCLAVGGARGAGYLTWTTGGASAAADLEREEALPRKLRGTRKQWGQLSGLAANEGNQLGHGVVFAQPSGCAAHCDAHAACNSVSFCPMWGCFMKDRVFTGGEATTPGSHCVTYYKIKGNTSVPSKKKCCGGSAGEVRCYPSSPEYDPETEQCCGEGQVNTATVCGKGSGCCLSGYSGYPKCFDHGSQQCCGQNHASEMPVVCSLDVACPSLSDYWRECPTTTPAPTKKKCCGGSAGEVRCFPDSPEFDPETEQCCGEGQVNTATVCSKGSGCCLSGYAGYPKCFDHGSQQCCGQNHASEMPVVCSLDVACPSQNDYWRECPTTTPAPSKKKCCGGSAGEVRCYPDSPEYDPETEQCCGEGQVNAATVCSKGSGCCLSGYSGYPKCFDHDNQQCCGQNHASEMPLVCSLNVSCPSKSNHWRQCPAAVAAGAVASSSGSAATGSQLLFP